ncbi:hypothetical protein [Aeromonas veronii]|uniref:hypothetical protein n=1 Tax=Aeromonas veronii TaxID=654 RepID=UPI001F337FF1|nr:hypothetical protein [Aeromonas veronii]MCF5858518.1 hypothetical protein [Aeromonas veronii]
MIKLNDHIATLSHIIFSTEDIAKWGGVYQWLQIAASLESISINTIKYNQSFGWCSHSDEFDLARDQLLTEFTEKLAVFNFVWGALEAAIEIVKPPKNPNKSKQGKISDTCFWLSSFNQTESIPELFTQTEKFRTLAKQVIGYKRVESRMSEVTYFGISGIGLYSVYELRNLFAHGSMEFPYPDGDNKPVCIETSLVECATRIVLLSMQLLMLKHFPTPESYEIFITSSPCSLDGDMSLSHALRMCHLESDEQEARLA